MFKSFLVKNPFQAVNKIFSGKIKIENNPSVGCAYKTTKIYTPIEHEGQTTIRFIEKKISGPPACININSNKKREQKGAGIELEEILQHPVKISEKEFDQLSAENRNDTQEGKDESEEQPPANIQDLSEKPSEEPQPPANIPVLSEKPPQQPKPSSSSMNTESDPQSQQIKAITKRKSVTNEKSKPRRKRIKKYDFNLV